MERCNSRKKKDFRWFAVSTCPPGQVRTCPNHDFWSNFARFGSRNGILTKFINDSASFSLEKLKNTIILTQNLNI